MQLQCQQSACLPPFYTALGRAQRFGSTHHKACAKPFTHALYTPPVFSLPVHCAGGFAAGRGSGCDLAFESASFGERKPRRWRMGGACSACPNRTRLVGKCLHRRGRVCARLGGLCAAALLVLSLGPIGAFAVATACHAGAARGRRRHWPKSNCKTLPTPTRPPCPADSARGGFGTRTVGATTGPDATSPLPS